VFSRQRNVRVNKNRIEVYRKGSTEKLWEKKYDDGRAVYRTTAYGIIEQRPDRTQLLDYATGKAIWRVGNGSISGYVNDMVLIRGILGTLEGYSLRTGEKMWKATLDYDGGLCNSSKIDETHDMFVADNVYNINWTNGTTKYLKAKTSILDKEVIAETLLSALIDVSIGSALASDGFIVYPVFSYGDYYTVKNTRNGIYLPSSEHRITGIASRVLSENGKNYFADRNSVTCFDDNMNPIWKVESPGEKASKSELVKFGESIYMVNFGYAIKGGQPRELGIPYIAELKANDGTQVFYKELYDKKKIMLSMAVEKDKIRMLFDNAVYSLSVGDNEIRSLTCESDKYENFSKFIASNQYFVKSQDNFFTPMENLTSSSPVLTKNGYVLNVSEKDGKSEVLCNESQIYKIIGNKNGMTFIRGGRQNKELWAIGNGSASLLCSYTKKVWVLNNQICILLDNGTILHLEYQA